MINSQLSKMFSFISLSVWLIGCASIPVSEVVYPFKVDEDIFLARVKTVVFTPLAINKLDNSKQIQTNYENLITKKLMQVGIKVIPSEEYSDIWNKLVKKSGGTYDPYTGLDREKYKQLRENSIKIALKKFNADGLVVPTIVVRRARWRGNNAAWDGKIVPTSGEESTKSALALFNASGYTSALSLSVKVLGADQTLYHGLGGIQLLAYLKSMKYPPVSVPDEELFVEAANDVEAVEIALSPLIEAFEKYSQLEIPDPPPKEPKGQRKRFKGIKWIKDR